ncbi:MAG: hypothetical protein WBF33_32275, partial [Candidatus Nitrosopolaris sp.]
SERAGAGRIIETNPWIRAGFVSARSFRPSISKAENRLILFGLSVFGILKWVKRRCYTSLLS